MAEIRYTEDFSKFSKCGHDFARCQRSAGYYKANNKEKRKIKALDDINIQETLTDTCSIQHKTQPKQAGMVAAKKLC